MNSVAAAEQQGSLSAALEPIIAAAMRGQYELLMAEAERTVATLFPGTRIKVLMRVGGVWREWSTLEGGSDQTGEPVPDEMQFWDSPRRFGERVFVPINVGAVSFLVDGLGHGDENSDTLQVLRRCFALALQTCERQRIASQNLDEVQVLQRVAIRMLKSHDLSEILLHITQETKRLLSSDICGVLLREGEHIVMRRCVGNKSSDTAALRMGPGQGLAGRVLARREPASVEDYLSSDVISRDFFHLAEAEMVRSALAAPLLGHDKVIGVLEVWRRRPSTFSALDNVRLVALANLTSIAIENAELYAAQQKMVEELGRANEALNIRYDAAKSMSNLTQALMQVLLQGGGLPAIVARASSFLKADVAIVGNDGDVLASSTDDMPPDVLATIVAGLARLRSASARSASEGIWINDAEDTGTPCRWRAHPLVLEGEAVGWVLGRHGDTDEGMTEFTLSQVAVIAALQRLEQRAASRARAETIDVLVWDLGQASESVRTAALDRAVDVKLELGGPLRLYLSTLDTVAAVQQGQGVASIRRQVVRAVEGVKPVGVRAVAIQGLSVAILCADEPLDAAERTAQRFAQRLSEELGGRFVGIGASSACAHARSLSTAFREAQIALDVARQIGRTGAVVYDRAGVVGLLLTLRHEAGMQRFVELNFGQLLHEDEKQKDQLLQTLRVFFDVNCSQEAAASRLGVHRKTIAYRLAKVCELTGLDLSTHDDRLVADLSLYVYRLLLGQTEK
jgi:sugar diacid utilization regulator/putative methionine-R-sulfoxide reductase with GAF domain